MRRFVTLFTVLILVVPLLFTGCQKENISTEPAVKDTDILKSEKIASNAEIDYCVAPVTFALVGENWTPIGDIIAGNDANNFYVTLTAYHQNWSIKETRIFIGHEAAIGGLIDPSTSYPDPNLLPNLIVHNPAVQTYIYEFPLDQLEECFSVMVYAMVEDGGVVIDAFGGNLTYNSGKPRPYYFNFCVDPCTPPVTSCETAFAFGGDYANPFSDWGFHRWGWTNGPIGPGTYSWLLYAGAGRNDLEKGTVVGTLEVDYDGSMATVAYQMFDGFTLEETHLFVGNDVLPKKNNGQYTLAPGQYPYKHDGLNGASSDYYEVYDLSGELYIIGHSVACGNYE